jgi:hypothetical protein
VANPKFDPRMVTIELQPRPVFGVTSVIVGAATSVAVAVVVTIAVTDATGVFVDTGVIVGVAVAPNAAMTLKPDVTHGRNPSA